MGARPMGGILWGCLRVFLSFFGYGAPRGLCRRRTTHHAHVMAAMHTHKGVKQCKHMACRLDHRHKHTCICVCTSTCTRVESPTTFGNLHTAEGSGSKGNRTIYNCSTGGFCHRRPFIQESSTRCCSWHMNRRNSAGDALYQQHAATHRDNRTGGGAAAVLPNNTRTATVHAQFQGQPPTASLWGPVMQTPRCCQQESVDLRQANPTAIARDTALTTSPAVATPSPTEGMRPLD